METANKIKNHRNYGIDSLRIISMLYVVILHCLGQGGVLDTAVPGTPQYMVAWFLEIWAYGAVNIFAIISGYVGYSQVAKRTKYSSYIVMWLQVVAYGVAVTLGFKLIYSELVSMQDLLDMFLPVSNGLYWYFTAYTGLFFVIPLLNAAVRGCTEKQLKRILLAIGIVYVCFDNIVQQFWLEGGYSFVWLVLLYLIGAILKKCDIGKNIKPAMAMIGIVVLITVSWLWKMYGFEFPILGTIANNNLFVSYMSPTIVGASVLYVIGFSKIHFPKVVEKIISFLAPGAFAVYILNNQRFVWSYVMFGRFAHLAAGSVLLLIGEVIWFSVAFVIISILIDRVRILVFQIFRINHLAEKISKTVDNLLIKWNV